MAMTAADYRRYVEAFNTRDYDVLCGFFAEDVVLELSGFTMRGRQAIRDFYAFFHDHVREVVQLKAFFEGPESSFADVLIRFEGIKDVTQEMLDARRYGRMTPVPAGGAVEIEFFILYEQPGGGPITHIRGAVYEPARD